MNHVGVAKIVFAFTSESFILLTDDPALDDSMFFTRFVLAQVFGSLEAQNVDVLVLFWLHLVHVQVQSLVLFISNEIIQDSPELKLVSTQVLVRFENAAFDEVLRVF